MFSDILRLSALRYIEHPLSEARDLNNALHVSYPTSCF